MGRYYVSTLFTIIVLCLIGCGTYLMIKCSTETLEYTTTLIEDKSFEHKLSEASKLVQDDLQFDMSSNMNSARQALQSSIDAVKGAKVNADLTKNNDGDWLNALGNTIAHCWGGDDESIANAEYEKAQAAFEIDLDNYTTLRAKDEVFNGSVDSKLGIMKYKNWIIIGGIIIIAYLFLVIIPILLTNKTKPVGERKKKSDVTVQQAYPQAQPIFLQIPSNYYQQPDQAVAIKQEARRDNPITEESKEYYYKDVSWNTLESLCTKYGLQKDYVLQVYNNDVDKACARINMYGVSCEGDTKRIMAKIHMDKEGLYI